MTPSEAARIVRRAERDRELRMMARRLALRLTRIADAVGEPEAEPTDPR